MTSRDTSIARLDWTGIAAQLDMKGYAVLPGQLGEDAARTLARQTEAMGGAQRVPLISGDLGRGELFYFSASLPAPLEDWRAAFYRHLAVIANHWNEILGIGSRYPVELEDFLLRNRQAAKCGRYRI